MSPLERYGKWIREINRLESNLSLPFYRTACDKRQALYKRVVADNKDSWRAVWDEVRAALQEG